jgi:hypothetical protein
VILKNLAHYGRRKDSNYTALGVYSETKRLAALLREEMVDRRNAVGKPGVVHINLRIAA